MYSQKSILKANVISMSRKNKLKTHQLLDNFKKKRLKRFDNKPKPNKILEQKDYTINEEQRLAELKNKTVVPVSSGEELIKISKETNDGDTDSDVEIDIDEDSSQDKSAIKSENLEKQGNSSFEENSSFDDFYESSSVPEELQDMTKNMGAAVLKFLTDMETPKAEYIFNENHISEVEKFVHSGFFEGKSVKTPARYLKVIFTLYKK